jgi:hypothetical protein
VRDPIAVLTAKAFIFRKSRDPPVRQPIIFIGMHRSGTSMLGRLLENLGLFAGTRKDENNEALFFQEINTWLLAQCGGRWDMPAASSHLWRHEKGLPWIESYIRNLLDSPRSIQFLGLRRYLAGGMKSLDAPWGWKDPRNTFTLPIWLRVFPQAKVISIERHGVDVAQSLRVREARNLDEAVQTYQRYRSLVFLRPKGGGFVESPRCTFLDGGFSLWKEYSAQARSMIEQLPGNRSLALRYEEVLENPLKFVRDSAEFCGLEASDSRLREVVATIKADRANSYASDPELRQFALDHAVELAALHYPDRA